MKKSTFVPVLGLISIAGALCAADGKPEPCSLATMKGEWGMVVSGIRPSAPNGPLEQFVGTLIRRYDGNGGFTQVDNVHGAISGHIPDRPGKGTYILNPDCTGVAKLEIPGVPFAPEARFVLVDDRNGFFPPQPYRLRLWPPITRGESTRLNLQRRQRPAARRTTNWHRFRNCSTQSRSGWVSPDRPRTKPKKTMRRAQVRRIRATAAAHSMAGRCP